MVFLQWDGRSVGTDRRWVDTVFIPSINDFKVLGVVPESMGDRYLSVRFSDPPRKDQDFRGLIEVPEQGGIRYQVEGNEVRVYSSNEWLGSKTVRVNAGIRNRYGKHLQNPESFTVAFQEITPDIRFVGKGVILPGGGKLNLSFEAVNLRAVTVSVVRVFAGNVPQFLQVNALDGDRELYRVGRPILKKSIPLNPTSSGRAIWTRYTLDLTELAHKDAQPGTLYRVTLSMNRSQSTYPCSDDASGGATSVTAIEESGLHEVESDVADNLWDQGHSDYGGYNWNERNDPCTKSYYNFYKRKYSRNFLASDVGLMAKSGRPGKLLVVATHLLTAAPLGDADLEILNYQHQVIAKGKTNQDGFAELEMPGQPFLLRAAKENQRGYLKLDEPSALQLGQFDVGGQPVQEGLKGFLFGERGVWRPGDSLYLTFILEDRQKRLPAGHPLTFELRNPQGQVVRTLARTATDGGIHSFATATDSDAPTGNYLARVKAGPAVFEEPIKIETVVPNRLKIKIDFAPKPLSITAPIAGNVQVSWLSGALAKHLEAEVEMTLNNAPIEFKGFAGYSFSDPARSFSPETQTLYRGRIDTNGQAAFSKPVKVAGQAPGALRATFRTKVMEPGGGFSLDRWSEPFHPYSSYIGVKLPITGRGYEALSIDSTHTVKLAALDHEGRRLPGQRRIEMKVFKVGWNWWWDRDMDGTNWLRNESKTRVLWDTVNVVNGAANWSFSIKYPDYGQYVIRACDMGGDGGKAGEAHCTGQSFYMDWPYGYGRANRENQGSGAAILSFDSDKSVYQVGEKIRLTIPSPRGGRALISIEKGAAIYRQYWVDMQENKTVHEIEAEPGMAPNVYVYVALLQPHSQTENDLPIRLYNVIPISVEDPHTRLKPQVKAEPAIFRPGEKGNIHITEANGKAMQYVVAVVDEGLLDLTRFKTPDPWGRFYAREALGIKTWDLYDYVAGAYGDRLERILSIGGDEGGIKAPDGSTGNRFPPMVSFLGPFQLAKGAQARHEISIPQYVGSVRMMVVASNSRDGAYGSAEQSIFVRKPLMILGTLPRILSPGETFELPVSVFAMEKHVKKVEVEVTVTGPIAIVGDRKKTLVFEAPTDELVSFRLETREAVGWGKVTLKARSGKEKAEQTIEINIRNPNTKVTDVMATLVQPGGTWKSTFKAPGVPGTNKATLELSRLPPVDLGKRLGFLISYPHGCVEQTTSAAFPQLYLDALMDLPANRKSESERNIKAAIHRLRSFQTPSGGFGYWQGDPNPNDWSSSYAGHFLVEAEKKGYSIPAGVLDQWRKYQRNLAQTWKDKYDYWAPLSQSYRLYTLALAGAPEMGAMNRLKESKKLSPVARWQLGGAYQLAGQTEVATSLVQGPAKVKTYTELNGTFGSDLRDKSMMLEVLSLMGRKTEATPLMQEVATELSKESWMSTQTTAYALIAMARYTGKIFDRTGSASYAFKHNDSNREGSFTAPFHQEVLKVDESRGNQMEIRNRGEDPLYVRVITEGIPSLGQETDASQGINLAIDYKDLKGNDLDPAQLEQGKDFLAEIRVRHAGRRGRYEQLALSTLFPSGWEIRNTRMDQIASPTGKGNGMFNYQDFRDDRVLTYFHLNTDEEKVFNVYLNAAYLGRYHLPQSRVEAMYDATINARTKGRRVEVVSGNGKPGNTKAPSSQGSTDTVGTPGE